MPVKLGDHFDNTTPKSVKSSKTTSSLGSSSQKQKSKQQQEERKRVDQVADETWSKFAKEYEDFRQYNDTNDSARGSTRSIYSELNRLPQAEAELQRELNGAKLATSTSSLSMMSLSMSSSYSHPAITYSGSTAGVADYYHNPMVTTSIEEEMEFEGTSNHGTENSPSSSSRNENKDHYSNGAYMSNNTFDSDIASQPSDKENQMHRQAPVQPFSKPLAQNNGTPQSNNNNTKPLHEPMSASNNNNNNKNTNDTNNIDNLMSNEYTPPIHQMKSLSFDEEKESEGKQEPPSSSSAAAAACSTSSFEDNDDIESQQAPQLSSSSSGDSNCPIQHQNSSSTYSSSKSSFRWKLVAQTSEESQPPLPPSFSTTQSDDSANHIGPIQKDHQQEEQPKSLTTDRDGEENVEIVIVNSGSKDVNDDKHYDDDDDDDDGDIESPKVLSACSNDKMDPSIDEKQAEGLSSSSVTTLSVCSSPKQTSTTAGGHFANWRKSKLLRVAFVIMILFLLFDVILLIIYLAKRK